MGLAASVDRYCQYMNVMEYINSYASHGGKEPGDRYSEGFLG
jgi:hypothetical protein